MKLSDPYLTVPAAGWTFTDPDTKLKIDGDNPWHLLRRINEHRDYRKLSRLTVADLELHLTANSAESVAGETRPG